MVVLELTNILFCDCSHSRYVDFGSNIYLPVGSALRDLVHVQGQFDSGRGGIMYEPKVSTLSMIASKIFCLRGIHRH